MPGAAFGDTISGTTLAGGIAAALLQRERTGETAVVDVSLLHADVWTLGMVVDLSMATGHPWRQGPLGQAATPTNPIVGVYRTADGWLLQLMMNRPSLYWEDFCGCLERRDLLADDRFATAEALAANARDAEAIIAAEIARFPVEVWRARFARFEGQWAVVQDSFEVSRDELVRANGYIATVAGDDGETYELVTSEVLFDETPITLRRSPHFAEHTDELLREVGFDDEGLLALKISGAVT